HPFERQRPGGRMIRINDSYRCRLYRWMCCEVGAHKLSVPAPIIFSVRRGVDSHESSSIANEPFECGLLIGVENLARRIQEYDDSNSCQVRIVELSGVFCGIDSERIRLP